MQETYLNHPTFGLLFSLCPVGDTQALFTTLYAQRLFFKVSVNPAPGEGTSFEPVSRNEARHIIEDRLKILRRAGKSEAVITLQHTFKMMFM